MSNPAPYREIKNGLLIAAAGGVLAGVLAVWLSGVSINPGTVSGALLGLLVIMSIPSPRRDAEAMGRAAVSAALAGAAYLVIVIMQLGELSRSVLILHFRRRPPAPGLPAGQAGINLTQRILPAPVRAA